MHMCSMPACSTIGSAMTEGLPVALIGIGCQNTWLDKVDSQQLHPRKECIEVHYPRSWHSKHTAAIIEDEEFQDLCIAIFDDMMVVVRKNLLKGGGLGSVFAIIDTQADQACSKALALVVGVIVSVMMLQKTRKGTYFWNVLNKMPDKHDAANIEVMDWTLKHARVWAQRKAWTQQNNDRKFAEQDALASAEGTRHYANIERHIKKATYQLHDDVDRIESTRSSVDVGRSSREANSSGGDDPREERRERGGV